VHSRELRLFARHYRKRMPMSLIDIICFQRRTLGIGLVLSAGIATSSFFIINRFRHVLEIFCVFSLASLAGVMSQFSP
jgi:hypothetical protein